MTKRSRLRGLGAGVLVGLMCVSLFAATLGVWSRRSLLKTDVWASRAGPVIDDPAVQRAISVYLTNQIMTLVNPEKLLEDALPERGQFLAIPLATTIKVFVADKVDEFVASPQFAKLWKTATLQAHTDAVRLIRGDAKGIEVVRGRIALNLLPILNRTLAGMVDASPKILGERTRVPVLSANDIPDVAREKLAKALGRPIDEDFGVLTVYDGDQLKAVQDAVKLFDRVVYLLIGLTVLLIPLALVVSTRRRRTALQMVVGAALVMIVVRRLAFVLISQTLALVKVPVNEAAAETVLHAFLNPLINSAGYVAAGLLVVGLVLVMTGSYPWVVSLRTRVASTAKSLSGSVSDRAADPATSVWVAAHLSALQIGGWAALGLGLWQINLTWLGLGFLVGVIALYQVVVARLASGVASGQNAS